jgi:hypothetical protein
MRKSMLASPNTQSPREGMFGNYNVELKTYYEE